MNNSRMPTIIDINQIISWRSSGELVVNPIYQRNKVWKEPAKSYLIDSIMRDYPIPPIFIREKLYLAERKTKREIVDGQQRITAILDYYDGKFAIQHSHNKEIGGILFNDLKEEWQEIFLTYKIYIEKITEKDDSLIYDMFARLNSNSVPLNNQELRNAKYSGEFKVAAYDLALKFREIFKQYGIFNKNRFSRMDDVEFVSILMIEAEKGVGAVSKALIDKYYLTNNNTYSYLAVTTEILLNTMSFLQLILPQFERGNNFYAPLYFYDLFTCIRISLENGGISENNKTHMIDTIAIAINRLDSEIANTSKIELNPDIQKYIQNHKTHTQQKETRSQRVQFLDNWIKQCNYDR